jgi:hypothetical protein
MLREPKESNLSFKEQNSEKLLGFSNLAQLQKKVLTYWTERNACVPLITIWNLWFQVQMCVSRTEKQVQAQKDFLSESICNVPGVKLPAGTLWETAADWEPNQKYGQRLEGNTARKTTYTQRLTADRWLGKHAATLRVLAKSYTTCFFTVS